MLEVLHQSPSSCSKAADHQLLLRVDDVVCGGFTDDCESLFMSDNDLLIDFTCCDVVPPLFHGDILPDLEAVDPTELLAEFDEDHHHHEEEEKGTNSSSRRHHQRSDGEEEGDQKRLLLEETAKVSGGDEVLSTVTAAAASSDDTASRSSSDEGQRSNKTTTKKKKKNSNGKRKVDWTPDLHRRFVQAVEQLGIDKAVPSRILEIMGIECLTRHNIASHLQKYRSHRKHLMAREAEAATWAHKRQLYAAATPAGAPPPTKKDMPPPPAVGPCPWVLPTIGFPPFARPLHVWGHPSTTAVEAPTMLPAVWPRHLQAPATAYWHHQYNRKWTPHQPLTQCVPPTTAAAAMLPRFPAMMPHPMYRPPMMMPPPQTRGSNKLATLQIQIDTHPSKESIDAAIGDVLVKPWLPLPLGLKPPSLHSVMSELHKQGIPKIPPAATTTNSSTSNTRA